MLPYYKHRDSVREIASDKPPTLANVKLKLLNPHSLCVALGAMAAAHCGTVALRSTLHEQPTSHSCQLLKPTTTF